MLIGTPYLPVFDDAVQTRPAEMGQQLFGPTAAAVSQSAGQEEQATEAIEAVIERPSVLLATTRTDDAAARLTQHGSPITVSPFPPNDLALTFQQILGTPAGLEKAPRSEVETVYGIRLNELADHLNAPAQLGA